jgi:uncharacterized surface protein with fasciclin (FAS1) repeats
MVKPNYEKMLAALLIALLLTSSWASTVSAAVAQAPVAQQLRDTAVRGTLPGGQFAKIWLGLQPAQSGAQVTVAAEWDRPDADANGVGFFILDDNGLRQVGESSLSSIAVGAGNQGFFLNGPSNMQGAAINAVGLAIYTIVVYNDSGSDANFTLTATNGFITDESGQVTGVNTTGEATTEADPATDTLTTTTETTTTTTTTTTTETTEAAPVATTAAATPAATTATTTTTAAATPAPTTAAAVTTGEVRATTMQGDLPEQDDQHFLGLVPSQRDGNISLSLTFDPQDSSELARRLNFWVLDEAGLNAFLRGTSPGEVAIAAGNRTFRGDTNERVASFNAAGFGPYTVIVYNNSRVPGSYTLTVEGGTLIDDANQTRTAQAAATGTVASTGAVTTTSTVTGTTGTTTTGTTTTATTSTGTTTTPATTTTTTGRTGEPGGTYTVQSGDTLALIARDIYGDYRLYEQICAFNGIANCNLIEVGDIIRLPTQAQIQSGATAATTTTTTAQATPTAAATPAATQPAASAAVTSSTAVTGTTGVTTTTSVTPTRATTAGTTSGTSTTPAASTTTTTTGGTTASGNTVVDAMIADGRFTSLVEALEATGLDSVLEGNGPYTVFAPTDAAFAALPAGAFEQLLNDPSGQLTDILRYHLVPGDVPAEDISNGMEATTVQGKTVRFEVQGNTIKINGANLVTRDIQTENGVVHVIDAVILPPPE